MSKATYTFSVTTALIGRAGEHAATAYISGECDYDKDDNEWFDYCYADLRIKTVILEVNGVKADGTLAYHVDRAIVGNFHEAIEKAVHAFIEPLIYGPDTSILEPLNTHINQSDTFKNFM